MKASGVILAGGKSSRMGQDKSMLEYHGEMLIGHCVRELRMCVDELIIVGRHHEKYGFRDVKEITDSYRDIGPLAGIHAGLKAAANRYVFFAACDMPFIDGQLVKMLLENTNGYDVVVPRTNGLPEPLFAVYAKDCLPTIESNIEKKLLRIVDFYPLVKVNYIEEDIIEEIVNPKQAFTNINTREDYNRLCLACDDLTGSKLFNR